MLFTPSNSCSNSKPRCGSRFLISVMNCEASSIADRRSAHLAPCILCECRDDFGKPPRRAYRIRAHTKEETIPRDECGDFAVALRERLQRERAELVWQRILHALGIHLHERVAGARQKHG